MLLHLQGLNTYPAISIISTGFFLKLSRGRMTLTSILTGLPVVVLTTTGAKSGLPRTTPVLCISDANDPTLLAVIASNWGQDHHPAWYYNLNRNRTPRFRSTVRSINVLRMRLRERNTQGSGNMQWTLTSVFLSTNSVLVGDARQ